MPKVALVQVVYNSRHFMPRVIPAALSQTERDVAFYAVIAGNEDGGREYLERHHPEVRIIDPGENVGFARGHNLVFSSVDAQYFQLVNPDLILAPDFVQRLLEVFEDSPDVGAVGGKLLNFDFENDEKTKIIDSTGVLIRKTGRALDRGQHEVDQGQYDHDLELMAVSGAGAMFRREALEDVAEFAEDGSRHYFDESFHSYFEDVDLCWRAYNRGWQIRYQPTALAWHGRAVASSPGGYGRIGSFIRHRREIPVQIRRLNYRNHVLMFVKNSPRWFASFFAREFFYNIYILMVETSVLKALPGLWKELPRYLNERRHLASVRKLSAEEAERLMN